MKLVSNFYDELSDDFKKIHGEDIPADIIISMANLAIQIEDIYPKLTDYRTVDIYPFPHKNLNLIYNVNERYISFVFFKDYSIGVNIISGNNDRTIYFDSLESNQPEFIVGCLVSDFSFLYGNIL